MKIKINKETLFLYIYILFMISRLLSYINNWEHSFYTPFSLLFLFTLVYINIGIHHKVFNQKICQGVIIGYVLWTLWGAGYGLLFAADSSAVIVQLQEATVFYLNVFLSARVVSNYNSEVKFIKTNLLVLAMFLIWRYIAEFNGLDVLNSLASIFDSDFSARYRYSYGLYHVNGTGNLCWCFLMLLFLYFYCAKSIEKKKYNIRIITKTVYMIVSVIVVIMLLSTASRNSITSIIVFFCALLWLNNYSNTSRKWRAVKAAVVLIVIGVFMWTIDLINLLAFSNRLFNFTHNVPLLTKYNSWFTGLGFVDSGYFGSKLSMFDSIYVDNFYLYVLLSTGIIGCAILFVPIIQFVFKFIKRSVDRTPYDRCVGAMLISCLYSAFFETNLLYPMFVSSLIFWVIFLSSANRKVELYEN